MKNPLKDTFQHILEWQAMLNHIGKFNSFIEIGSYKGGTFSSLADIATGKKISIDLSTGAFGGIGQAAAKARNERLSKQYTDTYFIEGDSKKIETILKLNSILQGEKVDFLFIDGDHTYKGALADYMIYKQFVKQGGYIAFHDIVDSDFHRRANCFVSTLWNKLDNGFEFISPDNCDASPDAVNMGSNIWGGIGVIKNDYSAPVNIFQVFYNQQSLDECINAVQNYIPTLFLNLDNVFFENAVIQRIYEEINFSDNSYIGVTSPLVTEKTGLTIDDIVAHCNGVDVVNYWNEKICKLNVWSSNRENCTNLNKAAKELNSSLVIDYDLFEKKWHTLYCNFWVCKKAVFEEYCYTYLTRAIGFFKPSKWTEWDNKKTGLLHRGRYYPMAVFVIEGLFGTMLGRSPKLKIKKLQK